MVKTNTKKLSMLDREESKSVETREKKVNRRFSFFGFFRKKKKTSDKNSIPASISLEPDILWSKNSLSDKSQPKSKKGRQKKTKQLTNLVLCNNSWDTVNSPIFGRQNQTLLPTLDDLDHQLRDEQMETSEKNELNDELISSMTLSEKSVAEKSYNHSHDVEGDIANDGNKNSINYHEFGGNINDESNVDKEKSKPKGYLKYLMDLNLDSYDSAVEYTPIEGSSAIESNLEDEKMPSSRYNYSHSLNQNRSIVDINSSLRMEKNEEIGRNPESQISGTASDHNATSGPLENNQTIIPPKRSKHRRVLSIRSPKNNISGFFKNQGSVFPNLTQSEQKKTTRNFDHLPSHLIPNDLEVIPELESENSHGSESRKERSLKTLVASHENQTNTSSNGSIINVLGNQMEIPIVNGKNNLNLPVQQLQSPPDRFDELTGSNSSPLSTIDKNIKTEESQKVLKELWSELSIIFFNIQGKTRHRLCQAPESCHASDPENCRKDDESSDPRPSTLRIKGILEQMMQEIDKSLEDDSLYGIL